MKFAASERCGEGGHGAGVDASAEEDSDIHIAAELVADSFAEKFAGGLGGFIEGAYAHGIVFDRQIVKVFGSATGG